jgi:hypothetical protein
MQERLPSWSVSLSVIHSASDTGIAVSILMADQNGALPATVPASATTNGSFPAPDAAGETVAAVAQAGTISAGEKCAFQHSHVELTWYRRDCALRPTNSAMGSASAKQVRPTPIAKPITANAQSGSAPPTFSSSTSKRWRLKLPRTSFSPE